MNKINTFQGLRVVAFLTIFIWHLNGYMGISVVSFAEIAVTFFFMLSGFISRFTLDRHLKENDKSNIVKKSFKYAKNKMSKIYLIYLISLIIYIPLSVKNLIIEENIGILKYVLLFISNVFLLQAWKVKYFNEISYAGWYLSSLVFLYFVTISLAFIIKKINKNNKVLMNIILIVISFIGLFCYSRLVPSDTYYFYVFPVYRIFEYLIGMCIANIYLRTKNINIFNNKYIWTIVEFLIVAGGIYLIKETIGYSRGFVLSFTNILLCGLFIFVFMYQKGYISKLLSLKPIVLLGDISGEMYIIHNVFTAYILGVATRILPHNTYLAIFVDTFVLVLTIIISYVVHYKKYENIKKKLKTKLIHILGIFKRKKLKCKNFTIISNNCFAGVFYRNNALEYMSPTCGMFIMPEDYIKFIYNLKKYLNFELKEIKLDESNYKEYLGKIKYTGTIGKLNDIEIMFLHYKNFEEAKQKWERRSKRINFNNIIYKFNDQNNCTYEELEKFEKFEAKNKLCFTAKRYNNINSIVFTEFEKDGHVVNDSKEKIYKKYIDMYKYINERFGVNEKN